MNEGRGGGVTATFGVHTSSRKCRASSARSASVVVSRLLVIRRQVGSFHEFQFPPSCQKDRSRGNGSEGTNPAEERIQSMHTWQNTVYDRRRCGGRREPFPKAQSSSMFHFPSYPF